MRYGDLGLVAFSVPPDVWIPIPIASADTTYSSRVFCTRKYLPIELVNYVHDLKDRDQLWSWPRIPLPNFM